MAFQDAIQQAASEAEKRAVAEMQDAIAKMYTDVFNKAMAYTNLIVIAGYGAMFTLWSFTKDYLTPRTAQTVAVLLIISIGVFVAFEIFKMVVNAFQVLGFFGLLRPGMNHHQINHLLAEHHKRSNRKVAVQQVIWIPVLATCVLTGYGAGALLLWNFVVNLLGL